MDWLLPLVIAVVSSGALGSVFTTVYHRKCDKNDKKDKVLQDLSWLKEKSRQRDIEVAKLNIKDLLYHSPHERQAIISELEHYILDLKADSYIFGLADGWRKKEGVNIDYLRNAHLENSKEKYYKK